MILDLNKINAPTRVKRVMEVIGITQGTHTADVNDYMVKIRSGVLQGGINSPALFNVVMESVY